jgi:bifunctional UDP-N-acetylglucosamine pyrophosphorylase/glucosamine-1-phosphate N-acetyltransferase
MKSSLPKVMHRVAGRSMLGHVLDVVAQAGATRLAVVIGPGRDDVAAEVKRLSPDAAIFVQKERLGTAHAVLAARESLAQGADDVIVAYADTPLVQPETLSALRRPLAEGAAVVALGFTPADPTGYGRLITSDGCLTAIREEKDASAREREIRLCNAGLMAFSGRDALALLERIGNANAKGEYYLTDMVEVAIAQGLTARVVEADESEVQGVNDRAQLAAAERTMQERLRRRVLEAGVTLIDPSSVYLSFDTSIGRDVVVEPQVFFGPGVRVDDGATIHAFSHLEGATVASGVSVGPYARLRPGAVLASGSRVGNFVEVKNASIGEGAKVNHLTYLGDATIGAGANIGAGTITCNYDGFSKFRTVVGENAFIGSNSALVAPVSVGKGAFVGSGSVITEDVPDDALGLARGRQVTKDGWATQFRAMNARMRPEKS